MSLNLRVRIGGESESEGVTKTFRFAWSLSVHEAAAQIREKIIDPANEGGRDHALFLPDSETVATGLWLVPNRTLESYDLKQNDMLWFRKRHLLVKVRMADGSIKTVLVDLTVPVREYLPVISKKTFLRNIDEYHLKVVNSKTGAESWLKAKYPLTKQAPSDSVLILKKRFYTKDSNLDKNDQIQLHLAYIQAHEELVSGSHPLTREEAAMFGGLQCQMEHGAFKQENYKSGYTPIKLQTMLPTLWAKTSGMEKDVLQQWKNFSSLDITDARMRFMQLCQTLRSYGFNLFYVEVDIGTLKKPKLEGLVLGFNETKVVKMSPDCKAVLKEYPLEHVKKWTYDDKNIVLDFGEYEVAPFVAISPQRAEISDLIGGYIDIILKKMKARASGQDEDDNVAEETSVGTVKGTLTTGYTSSTTKSSAPQMKLQQICDFISGSTAIQSLFIPLDELRQIHIDGMKVSLSEEQMFSQISTNSSALASLVPEAMKIALSGDFAKQLEIAKQIAGETAKLMSSAQMAAFGFNLDPEQQRVIIESSKAVNDAMVRYMVALEALKRDPKNPALISAAEAAAFEVEAAITAFSATATGTYLDSSSQELLAELAKNVALAVNNLTRTATGTARAPNPQFNAVISQADGNAQMLVTASGMLGGLTANAKCKSKLKDAMEKVRMKAGEVVKVLGPAQGDVNAAGAWQREVENSLAQMNQMLECPRFEGNKEYLAYLTSANAVLEETAAVMNSQPLSMESAQQASKVIQQNYPVLVNYAKQIAQSGDDMTRDRALECSQQIHTSARAISSAVDASQDGITPQQMEKLVDDSSVLNSAVQRLLGEHGNEAARLALIDCAKTSAQTAVALVRASTKLANGPARSTNGANLLQAAANAVASIKALSESIIGASSEGDVRAQTNHLVEVADWFYPQVQDGLLQSTKDTLEMCPDGEERREAIVASQNAHKAIGRLAKATQAYKTVGNFHDIEWATEGFRAALADLEWTEMALEVGELSKGGQVDTALESMVAVAAKFGQSIKGVAATLKAPDKPIAPAMQDLSASCQGVANTVKNLVMASKYSREQKTIVEAGRLLLNEVNRLITSIKGHALNPTEQNLQQSMGCIAASAVALQKLSRTAKQLEGVPLAEGESEANLPQSDIALETKAEEILEKLCSTSDKAVANIRVSLERAKEQSNEDPKAQVQVAVLEALNALMGTASNVVQASYSAQAELVQSLSAPATRAIYARDPKMAQGLIEACAQVSTAISSLGSGDLSQSTQKEMISQAEGIAKACEVLAFATRAGTRSANQDSTRRIMEAAQKVSEAVKLMVAAAQQVEDVPDVEDENIENYGIDAGTLKEIKQMMKIVDLEKQLVKAKRDLDNLQKQASKAKEWNT